MKHMFMVPGSIESEKYIFFISEINKREKMSKMLNKYIRGFDHADKTSFVVSRESSSNSLALFVTAIEAPIGIASPSSSFVYLLINGIIIIIIIL